MGNIADIYGGQGFDPNSVDPATGYDPLPAGWYPVEIAAAEVKDTKAGTGKYLALELTVLEDRFNGRKLFPKINLMNPSEKAVEIGMRELAALTLACGLPAVTDSDELLGLTIECRVKIAKGQNGYEDDNEVTAYRALGGSQKTAPQAPRPPQAPAKAAPPASRPKRPWER